MKLLILLFLVGYAAAYAGDGYDRTLEGVVNDIFGEPSELLYAAESDDDVTTVEVDKHVELGKKLREALDYVLEKIKEALERGKHVRDELIEKLREIKDKLKDLRGNWGSKAKELYGRIRDKIKEKIKDIKDKLGKNYAQADPRAFALVEEISRTVQRDDDIQTELGKKLKEQLDQLLEKVKDALEKGKGIKDEYVEKLKELREKLKDLKVDLGNKAKELLEKIKEKAKDYWKKILEEILGKKDEQFYAAVLLSEVDELVQEAEGDETAEKLRERFQEILEKLKEAMEKGKMVGRDVLNKLKELREKMREKNVELGKKIKEYLEQLKEKATGWWKKILDRLGKGGDEETQLAEGDETADRLREKFQELLEKLKDAMEKGKVVGRDTLKKLKELKEKMREKNVELGNKIKEYLEQLKEKATGWWKKILDRLGKGGDEQALLADDDEKTELGKKLRERLDEILEKIKEALDKGKGFKEETLEKIKEIRQKLKDLKVDLGKKAKDLLEKIKEKAKDYWKRILDELVGKKEDQFRAAEFLSETEEFVLQDEDDEKTELGKKLRERLDEILEKIKEALDKGKGFKEETLEKIKEIRQKLKDLKVELGKKAKDLLEKIKEKAKDYWKKILDELIGKKDDQLRAAVFLSEVEEFVQQDEGDETADKIREKFQEILEKIKEAIEKGKMVGKDTLNKLKELREKMKEKRIELGNKLKEFIEKLKEKAKDFWKKILDRLGKEDDKEALLRATVFEREVEELIQQAEEDEDIKTELGKKLRETFDKLIEKLKEAIEKKEQVKEEFIEKIKEVREKLKELKIEVSEKAKELFNKIKEKAKDFLRDLLDKLGIKDKRSANDIANAESKIKGFFKKLKKLIIEKVNKEKVKEFVEKVFGKGSEMAENILNMLKEKGGKLKQKLLDLIDRILGDDEERETRSMKDMWEKIKDYFKKLNIELKEKYAKFGEWVKERVKEGVDASKTKLENIKGIAREFINHAKKVSKEVALEAEEFFLQYKNELGDLWEDIKKNVKEIMNRKE